MNTATIGTYIAVATYTNACSIPSHMSVKISVCDSTLTESWYQVDGGDWTQSDSISVKKGAVLKLAPHPSDGLGTWSWTGAGTSGTSREQTVNTETVGASTAVATYTNENGIQSRLSIKIIVEKPTGITENKAKANSFDIYPIPARSEIIIKGNILAGSAASQGIITNALGQVVLTLNVISSTSSYLIDISKLDAGTYYLKLISNEGITVKRFVKMK